MNARENENSNAQFVNNELLKHAKGAGPAHMANFRAGGNEYDFVAFTNGSSAFTNGSSFVTSEYEIPDAEITISLSDNPDTSLTFDMEQDSSSNLSYLKEMRVDQDDDDTADAGYFQPNNRGKKTKDKFNVESLSYELQVGYRILSNIMSAGNRCINKLFLYPVDDAFPETADYYEKIKEPMWMFKMKEKFEKQEYKDLTEFIGDFRLMIENCYRYNGPDNFVSKKAQKLELMMKQKVALLSRDLRDKIAGSSSNPEDDLLTSAGLRRRVKNPNVPSDDPSQQLLTQLRRDRVLQERVDRRQKVEDRKAMEHARVLELQKWEDDLLGPEVKDQIRTMWELPQIGLFVYLCMESLGLEEEVTQYQIERGLAVPRECSDFRRLMTSLLSTPNQRKSLKSFMPYHVWNSKLAQKLDYFYKVLSDKNGNQALTCYLLGLDTRAFKVMGKCNPLLKKQFHQLSYLKRVWILKNFCDFCMETQPYLQKTVDEIEAVRPMDVREVLLGYDARGNRYINFPMFTGKDIRIYKHPKHLEPSLESLHMEDWSVETEKASASSSRCSTPVNQKNNRMAETPSTSLRARALLQAAESEEASPLREMSTPASEPPEVNSSSDARPSSSNTTESISAGSKVKQASSKKRKRTSLFFNKRKRLKSNKKELDGKSSIDKSDELVNEKEEGILEYEDVDNVNDVSTQHVKVSSKVEDCDDVVNHVGSSGAVTPEKSSSDLLTSCSSEIGPKAADVKHSKSLSLLATTVSDKVIQDPLDSNKKCNPEESISALACKNSSTLSNRENVSKTEEIKQEVTVIKHEDNCGQDLCSSPTDFVKKSESSDTKLTGFYNNGKNIITNLSNISKMDSFEDKCCNMLSPIKQELFNKDMKNVLQNHSVKMESHLKQEMKNEDSVLPFKTDIKCEDQIAIKNVCKNISSSDESKNINILQKDVSSSHVCANNSDSGRKIRNSCSDNSFKEETGEKCSNGMEDAHSVSEKNGLNCQTKGTETTTETVKEMTKDLKKIEVKEAEEASDDEEDLPDLGQIELVAENMEEIRELIKKLSNPEPVKRKKKIEQAQAMATVTQESQHLRQSIEQLRGFVHARTWSTGCSQIKVLCREPKKICKPKHTVASRYTLKDILKMGSQH